MKTTKTILATIASLAFICGCDLANSNNGTMTTTNEIARAVCIGVENGFAGDCPGALIDAKRMKDLLKSNKLVDDVVLLLDKDASRSRVMKEMEKACKADLAIIFYSGHGGQNKYGDPSEEDGKDEFMCLYDRELLDNDIWNIVLKIINSINYYV